MPVRETKAKLWHPTQEERDAYDDQMIANIELKSLDFDDENFSPVFNRSKKEFFLELSEKYKKDVSRLSRPFQQHSCDEFIDKYMLIKPNHTYWREFTYTKFLSGFGLGYLFLRELPIRNFYARVFIMYVFIAKLSDHFSSILPFHGNINLVHTPDAYLQKDIMGYHNVNAALNFLEIPNVSNRIAEAKVWRSRQPAHLRYNDQQWAPHWITRFHGRAEHEAFWDGTMNQPLHRLADPYHKDAHMIHWA